MKPICFLSLSLLSISCRGRKSTILVFGRVQSPRLHSSLLSNRSRLPISMKLMYVGIRELSISIPNAALHGQRYT